MVAFLAILGLFAVAVGVWALQVAANRPVAVPAPVPAPKPRLSLAETIRRLEEKSGVATVSPVLLTQIAACQEPEIMAPTPETIALARAFARHEARLRARKARAAVWAQRKATVRQFTRSLFRQRF